MQSLDARLNLMMAMFAVVAAVLMLTACGVTEPSEAATPPPPSVSVAEVVVENLAEWDEFSGRLEAVDRVELRPRVPGYVQSVEFFEGARVNRGEVLFQIDPRPYRAEVDRLEAEWARAEAQRELAQSDHRRALRLLEQDALSREEFERRATAERAAAASAAAVAAALKIARLNLEFTRVTSPISGRVGAAAVTEGNLVDSQSVLTTVVSVDPMYVNFEADESVYLRHIRHPDAVERARSSAVKVQLSDESGYVHEGRFVFVDNEVNPATGTIRARAVLPNPNGRLTAGLFARVRVESAQTRPVTLIDDRAVGTDLGRKFVLAVTPQDTVEYRAVELGRSVDGLRVVRSGLGAGDLIVVSGLQRVRPGATISPQKVAMDRRAPALPVAAPESTATAATGGSTVHSEP